MFEYIDFEGAWCGAGERVGLGRERGFWTGAKNKTGISTIVLLLVLVV